MEEHIRHARPEEGWTTRGALVVKVGALLTVLSVIAVAGTHLPITDEAMLGQPSANAKTPATATNPAAPGGTTYFPSQYQLNAPEPGEPVPTF